MADVILAGYNIDAVVAETSRRAVELVHKGKNKDAVNLLKQLNPDSFTPETISAAYARISRDEREIPELRAESRSDVEKAKKSNKAILFGQSHKAVADGFMFNFDVLGLSRLAVEELEARRIGCGYIEKSQRYITLKGDFVKPTEFSASADDMKSFEELVRIQNGFYLDNLKILIEYQKEKNPELTKKAEETARKGVPDKANSAKNTYEGWAKEDARYSLGLATEAQIGVSFNARTLEHAIRIMRYSELAEVRELSKAMFNEVKDIAPSLIALADPEIFKQEFGRELVEDNYRETRKWLRNLVAETFKKEWTGYMPVPSFKKKVNVAIIDEKNTEKNIMAALLFANSTRTIEDCYTLADEFTRSGKIKGFIAEALKYKSEFDAVPREFEAGNAFNYAADISSSCYAQLKRHRIMMLLAQDYNPRLGCTIPESIKDTGLGGKLREVCDKSSELYYEFKERYGKAAEYLLTNAHIRRVLISMNAREHYHIAGMRCDKHAQWDIRRLADDMLYLAKERAPSAMMLACGKDGFRTLRKEIYGE